MSKPSPHSTHEEPEVTQEEAVPSDGRDVEGERLMKDVRNGKLQDDKGKGEAEDKAPGRAKADGLPDAA